MRVAWTLIWDGMEQGIPVPLGLHEQLSAVPLDQTLLPHATLSSLLGACSGCQQHPDFYASWLLFLTILCFKACVLVAMNEISISC